ncbi:MAG: PAS domain S-box protein, partial [Bacteroidales bacterium]|nr:PAS domain S-box protein [Bacteroidales bacterium]
MNSSKTTIDQLQAEISKLKTRILELEQAESEHVAKAQYALRKERELQEREKKYKDLFEKSKDAILILQNGKFVDCNKATIHMLRFKNKHEFLNKHPSVLSPEKQQDGKLSTIKADEMIAIALKNGSHRFEWDHKKSDGEIFPVEVLLTVIENNDDNQVLHTVWRDITERKQSENALKASEEKLSAVFENSTILLYAHSTDHVITYISPQVKDILGYTPDEVLFKWTKLASDNPINEIGIKKTEKAIKTRKAQPPFELELVHKNGEKVWVEVREVPVVKKGKSISIVGSLTDITDRKNAEEKLKQSEKRFKRLFNDLGDAVFVTSIKEDTMGDILEVNPAAVRQTGYAREELLNMNIIRDISIRGSGEIDTSDWNEKLKAGITVTAVEKKRRKDGTEYWTEVLVTPIDFSGEQASLSINHDITSRKIAEDELKASEEHFRALFENASIGFYRTTPEGEIVLANPALVHMLGYQSFEELANRDLKKESFDTVVPRNKILDIIDNQGFLKGYESVWKINNNETIYIRENA